MRQAFGLWNSSGLLDRRFGVARSRRNPKLRQPLKCFLYKEEQLSISDRGLAIFPPKTHHRVSKVAKYLTSTASFGSLYLGLPNHVKDICSVLDSIKDIEDLVAPSGDEGYVITYKPYRFMAISIKVEKV